jgi:molybdate transport system substrate-binding protein
VTRSGPVRAKVRATVLAAVLAAVPLQQAACGESGDDGAAADPSPDPSGDAELSGEIVVSAAASLTDAFEDIGAGFEAAHPDVEVTFTFGPSSGLATQIVEGAPADVAAFASEVTMETVVEAGAVSGDPRVFATNDLVIVTPAGNPQGITRVEDLVDAGTVALCGRHVPCGAFAQEVLDAAGVEIPESSVTRGEDVRSTLTAVSRGDAAGGMVYRTDAAVAAGDVETVRLPAGINAATDYPIASLAGSGNPPAAAAFVEFVLSPPAQDVLGRHGFGRPR